MRMLRIFKKTDNKAVGTLAVGCGGGGCNIANRLGRISGVDILTVNTDRKGLVRSRSNKRILLGDGDAADGCGGDVELGMGLTAAASGMIEDHIKKYLNIVIMAGLGGGTGTGSAGIIAETAKRNGSRVITMVTLPMSFEAGRRRTALGALDGIKKNSDVLFVIDGDRLAELDPALGAREAFSVLDQMMCESFLTMTEMFDGSEGETVFRMMRNRTITVSFADGMSIGKVARALADGLMTGTAATSQPVIFIRGNIPQDGSEDIIRDTVSKVTGFEPVFVRGQPGHGMSLTMLTPVGDPVL